MKKVKRLFEEFQPEHYELFLEPNRDSLSFNGRVTIKGRKTGRPSSRITLHQKDLKIKSAKITKHDKRSGAVAIPVIRTNAQKSFDELRLHTDEPIYPGEYTVELNFSGKITEPMHGIYPCNFEIDGQKKQLMATQLESHHAREAFPCVDEPEAKATFDLTLLTPAGETVIANTPVKLQSKEGKKLKTVFETTPKMSTYLLAFVYGELGYKSAKTKNGVEVRVYATPDKVELTDFALDVAVRCLEFFEDYYGVPYPLPKLDLIGLPDFSAGAMENWGLMTFRESVLYVDPRNSSIETKQYVAMVVSHEVSHMWFGNLVTMKWWNDLWLNESFANLMEYRAVDEMFPQWNIWRNFVQREVGSALSRDALPNVQALRTEVNHPDELGALFDPSIVYAKGGSLLNMVRHHIGEPAFRQGLKSYFEEFQYSNTVADDLWRHFEKASGIDVGALMENWLTKPGFPVVKVNLDSEKGALTFDQERLIVSPKPIRSSTIWRVPLAPSQKLSKDLLDEQSATVTFQASGDHPITLNHKGRSYFVCQYLNTGHFADILKSVQNNILDPIDRIVLLQSYLLLERAGAVSTIENIKLLSAYKNEREETVWGMLSAIIGNARNLAGKDTELEAKLNNFVRPIVKPLVDELGWKSAKDDSSQILKLRALALSMAAVCEDKAVIEEGQRLFKAFNRPADLPPDIRSVVYFIGVRYGTMDDFKKLIKLHNSLTNADEIDEIAGELTASRDIQKSEILLNLLKTEVRDQDIPHWIAWLMRNRYSTDITWTWLRDNWQWIEDKYSGDKSFDYFPRYVAMAFSYPDQLKEFIAFFGPKDDLALKRAIQLGVEEIEGRIAWRQANEKGVKDWLAGL